VVKLEISRFPIKERTCMPGSQTTQGRPGARNIAPVRVAFRYCDSVSALDSRSFAARWLAYAHPCQRFTLCLTTHRAWLGDSMDC